MRSYNKHSNDSVLYIDVGFLSSASFMYTTIHTVTSPVPDGSHKDHLEYSIAIIIVTYIWPLIVVCGTLGNILSFCVLMRQAMSDTSVYFYLAMLALADIGVLMLSAFKTWIRVISGEVSLCSAPQLIMIF